MAKEKKSSAPRKKRSKETQAGSRGLRPTQLAAESRPEKVEALAQEVAGDGGVVLGIFRDPVGGHWHVLAGLPLEQVQPTPFQRDLSPAHVERLANVIDRLDRFVDPVVAVRNAQGVYWTPNGHHRVAALRSLGARSVVALVLADQEVAYKILALNTEKAHNVREKSLEVIRMARSLAELDPRPEAAFATEFEEAAFITLGACYELKGRFSGGAYHPLLRRIDSFVSATLPKALMLRGERAQRLLALDEKVTAAIAALKARGFDNPYLRAFVLARINPLRFKRGATADFDDTVSVMTAAAEKFDASKVHGDQIAAASGPADEAG
jgi:ParB family transcriptional regulator, chromosome partitioning protein